MTAAVLTNLDGYMSAAGYDTDHPWRTEIATALAGASDVDSSIDHVQEAFNIACAAKSFMDDNIGPVMTAIVALSNFDSTDVRENQRQLGLINRLAKLGGQLVDEAVTHMESDEDEMQSKLDLMSQGVAA